MPVGPETVPVVPGLAVQVNPVGQLTVTGTLAVQVNPVGQLDDTVTEEPLFNEARVKGPKKPVEGMPFAA
jgi:hypothetical protein